MATRILTPPLLTSLSPILIGRARGSVLPSPVQIPLLSFSFRVYDHIHSVERQVRAMTSNVNGENGKNGDDGALEGEHNQWKFRAPYQIHADNSDFHARYEGSCHCGKIHYQLSREKPLDAKYCHCTTCQKIHGEDGYPQPCTNSSLNKWRFRSTFPVGCHLPQRRY